MNEELNVHIEGMAPTLEHFDEIGFKKSLICKSTSVKTMSEISAEDEKIYKVNEKPSEPAVDPNPEIATTN